MKKKIKLSRKTIKNLKLKLKKVSTKKIAPYSIIDNQSNGQSC